MGMLNNILIGIIIVFLILFILDISPNQLKLKNLQTKFQNKFQPKEVIIEKTEAEYRNESIPNFGGFTNLEKVIKEQMQNRIKYDCTGECDKGFFAIYKYESHSFNDDGWLVCKCKKLRAE